MKNIISGLLIANFTMISCTAINNSSSKIGKNQANIENIQWNLTEHTKGKTPTLTIENGKISGNAGCNNYLGNITINSTNGELKIEDIGSTKMNCKNLNEENSFLSMLKSANKYTSDGKVLELYKDKLLLVRFNK